MQPTAHPRSSRRTVLAAGLTLVSVLCLGGLGACRGNAAAPQTPTISRETFIATYVDLRKASMNASTDSLDSIRAEVLARHGVTQEDLLTFADVHGPDVTFMRDVWDEVERRLDDIHPADSAAARGGSTPRA